LQKHEILSHVLAYGKGVVSMKSTAPSPEWIQKAMLLSKDDAERILARMRKKIVRRLEHETIDPLAAVALQLQMEDEQLNEWRQKMSELREMDKG
jgi:hypothetical protein